jgi:FkbH-like protein
MKKLLIWDGDESLWNGTLVENGLQGLTLPEGRFELCKELNERGVIQSLASFNDQQEALLALEKFELTPMFVYPQAVFGGTKSDLITKIKEELNLSRYSDIVFVDDNGFNLAEVNNTLPEVITVDIKDFNEDTILTYFTKDSYSDDDRKRVRRYQEEQFRKQAANSYSGDKMEFLKSCQIRLDLSIATDDDYERVVDLVKRANRMSVLSEPLDDVRIQEELPNFVIGKIRDRFGDYGLSSLLWLSEDRQTLKGIVISCRLQGKGIGSSLLGYWINTNIGRQIVSNFTQTEFNAAMIGLYDWYKFEKEDQGDNKFKLSLDCKEVELPNWIEVSYEKKALSNKWISMYENIYTTVMWKESEKKAILDLTETYGDDILKTFNSVYTERGYWYRHPVTVLWHNDVVIGYHAITVNSDKYPNVTKSYYMLANPNYRGKGLGAELMASSFQLANKYRVTDYMTNSDEKNDGAKLYKGFGAKPVDRRENPFGSFDEIFEFDVKGILTVDDFIKSLC